MPADLTLLSNHGLALVCVARDPGMRLRDIAAALSVTERTAHTIVSDLVAAGYIRRHREGVRNRYEVATERNLGDPGVRHAEVGELLDVLGASADWAG